MGGELSVSSANGTLQLKRLPSAVAVSVGAAPPSIAGAQWTFLRPGVADTAVAHTAASLQFEADSFGVTTPCGGFSGRYTQDAGRIRTQAVVAAPQAPCAPADSRLQEELRALLQGSPRFLADRLGGVLLVDGAARMTASARYNETVSLQHLLTGRWVVNWVNDRQPGPEGGATFSFSGRIFATSDCGGATGLFAEFGRTLHMAFLRGAGGCAQRMWRSTTKCGAF